MRERRMRGWGAVLAAAVLVAGAWGLARSARGADDDALPEVSAEWLDDLDEQDSILDALEADEREAVTRSGMSGPLPAHEKPPAREQEGALDKAGKATLSILTVALSAAAAAAPFFLF
jgi:hypothetical protein